jgi:glutamate transport system permease protein
MSTSTSAVLYDEPGPRARRRIATGSVIALVILIGAAFLVYRRLDDHGQFEAA